MLRFVKNKFAILIPSRNNPANLKRALDSARAQSVDGLEIVVSDNSDESCRQQVTAVVDEAGDTRVRLIRPDRELQHADHWRFVIKSAKAEWVTVVTDRSLLHKRWFEVIQGHLSSARIISYCGIGVIKKDRDFLVQLPRFSGSERDESGVAERFNCLRMEFSARSPYLLNSVVHRSIFDTLSTKLGYCCGEVIADCGFYSEVVACGLDWRYLDSPLFVMHSAEGGIGNSLSQGQKTPSVTHLLTLLAEKGGLTHTPLPDVVTNMNLRVNELHSAISRAGSNDRVAFEPYLNALASETLSFSGSDWESAKQQIVKAAISKGVNLVRSRKSLGWSDAKSTLRSFVSPFGPLLFRLYGSSVGNLPVGIFRSLDQAIRFAVNTDFNPNSRSLNSVTWR